ncbi:acetamidase/formamidase [Tahibacter aquaticus]|uniref:Acetamidase/formamidase n=1 Tax=Tahibacter aquaticus TaxID=520092 RepID=A0A4R6Z2X0_9GAMM|nr:acetamidase/formamidase family protein [Tahibacter aquaticus]TDR45941.1 acetamidase/formamidase [Tahibacter aquaticus]
MSIRRFFLLALFACTSTARAAEEQWLLNIDLWGTPYYQLLQLQDQAGALSGTLDNDPVAGQRKGRKLHFSATDAQQARYVFNGEQQAGSLSGKADFPDSNHPERRAVHAFSARRLPARPPGPPRHLNYQADSYANTFSAERTPVLTLWPGDSVSTATIDSGGVDQHGTTVALFGNPQIGPFYVAGAMPGDTLVVRLKKIRLNRDYADSLDSIVHRALGIAQAGKATELGKPVRWKLDRTRGMASPENAGARLAAFEVPVRPMLGGLAVAPGFGSPPMSTGDTGRNGGNMDFNGVVEGTTVYLPVYQPGALLYLGDGHALQGDGETSQYALETSLDVEFSVEIQRGNSVAMPRVESPSQLMVLGQAGSLDEALRAATSGLSLWLQQSYGLSLSEVAQVLGSSVEYRIANLAGRSVGLVAAIDKQRLQNIPSHAAAPSP